MTDHILMCPPVYFEVKYSINPWMENQIGKVDRALALNQWYSFHQLLCQHANVELISPSKETPDMVFTANCGLVWGSNFIPSRFRHPQRQPEEPLFTEWFRQKGFDILHLPESITFEGGGDALPSCDSSFLWAGEGFRTHAKTHRILARELNCRVISLHLMNPHFYHLDTCLCPLNDGVVLYYPPAFDPPSIDLIEQNARETIIVSDEDALSLTCNAVLVESSLYMNSASKMLRDKLEAIGYTVSILPMSEFMKAGGANKCLTFSWKTSRP